MRARTNSEIEVHRGPQISDDTTDNVLDKKMFFFSNSIRHFGGFRDGFRHGQCVGCGRFHLAPAQIDSSEGQEGDDPPAQRDRRWF